jgi:hypothetical protein
MTKKFLKTLQRIKLYKLIDGKRKVKSEKDYRITILNKWYFFIRQQSYDIRCYFYLFFWVE